jgi:hypothetical protein
MFYSPSFVFTTFTGIPPQCNAPLATGDNKSSIPGQEGAA